MGLETYRNAAEHPGSNRPAPWASSDAGSETGTDRAPLLAFSLLALFLIKAIEEAVGIVPDKVSHLPIHLL